MGTTPVAPSAREGTTLTNRRPGARRRARRLWRRHRGTFVRLASLAMLCVPAALLVLLAFHESFDPAALVVLSLLLVGLVFVPVMLTVRELHRSEGRMAAI